MANFEKITSRENERLKHARRVRDGKETRSIFVEGVRLCSEVFRSGISVENVFVSDKFDHKRTLEEIAKTQANVFELSERLLDSIADTKSPQGIVLIARRQPTTDIAELLIKTPAVSLPQIYVYLNEVNNPSNLGAVIRTAEAAGVSAVLTSPGSADAFSPKALRASMGSAFRVPIVRSAELTETIKAAKSSRVQILAVDSKGKIAYEDVDWRRPSMLVFGSEAAGLPDEILNIVDETISIPMQTPVESLNLAVSCGIVLFEARRQTK